MLSTSIDPFIQEFERQFNRLARQSFDGGSPIRRADDVVLRFDLPGIDPGSLEVSVDRGVLSVSARREDGVAADERMFVRATGAFTRRVYLPEHLDGDRIDAGYANGVLTVRVPMLERATIR